MKDITVSVDEDVHRLARIRAAELETGAILAAARACGCGIVYSENLIAGARLRWNVREQPFADIRERQG